MATAENPFEDVLTDKEWSKARDKTGLTSGLTEKVSMSDELKTFHQRNDVAAARRLQEKIGIYEQVLKTKHSKDKYYAKLLKLVQELQTAVQAGISIVENAAAIEDVRQRLMALIRAAGNSTNRVQDMTQTKAAEREFTERYEALAENCRELRREIPEGTTVLPGNIVVKVVQLEKDYERIETDLAREAQDSEYDDEGPDSRGGRNDAQMHWDRVMVPFLTGLVNKALSKHAELELKGQPQALIDDLLRPVQRMHAQQFDPTRIKPITDSLKPDPRDPITTACVEKAEELLSEEIESAVRSGEDSKWFAFVQATTPKKEGEKKQTTFPGGGSPERDDKKAYAALLMKLASFKSDPMAGANFLNSKAPAALFPYEQSDGKKDPGGGSPSVLTKIRSLGDELQKGIKVVRTGLSSQPPDLDGARAEFSRLDRLVSQSTRDLPRHGDVVEKGLKQFILKPLEGEIAAKATQG